MNENELKKTIQELMRISKKLFVTVPICRPDRRYINRVDETDITHIIRYTKEEWMDILGSKIEYVDLCKKLKGEKAIGTLCTIINS